MKDYHINVFYSEDADDYIANIPDLQHCLAFGATPEEALQEVLKAKQVGWRQREQVASLSLRRGIVQSFIKWCEGRSRNKQPQRGSTLGCPRRLCWDASNLALERTGHTTGCSLCGCLWRVARRSPRPSLRHEVASFTAEHDQQNVIQPGVVPPVPEPRGRRW